MKIRQISNHIYELHSWMIWPINMWIVKKEDEIILIDTGMAVMASKIIKHLNNLGELKGIYLTHGHSDHAGSVNKLKNTFNVDIKIHEKDIIHAEGYEPFPRRTKKEKIVMPNILSAINENDKILKKIGLDFYHVTGHSPGHSVFFHKEDDVLIAGDLYRTKNNILMKPIEQFTADMNLSLINSEKILKQILPKIMVVSHGEMIKNPVEHLNEI